MKKEIFLRLRDLENVGGKKVDYVPILTEVLNYNNNWIGKRFVLSHKIKQAHKLISDARLIDPTKVELNPDCKIKIPKSVDNITFRAMMELQSTLGNSDPNKLTETICQIIAIVCYQENNDGKYDSKSNTFMQFKETILNSSLWEMIGLYNWICKNESESKLEWQTRFLSVHVEDKDFEQAGGGRMSQFNVINTIKMLCRDFNCNMDEAWQLSYALSQTNSYESASRNFTQDQMRMLKEVNMKRSQKHG